MKKNNNKKMLILGIFFAFVLILGGCFNKVNLNKISKKLSTYDIQLEYSSNNTVNATQTLNYLNNTGTTLNDIKFHLYATAFSEDATNKPVSTLNQNTAYPNGVNYGIYLVTKVMYNNSEIVPVYENTDKDILAIQNIELKKNKNVNIYFEYTFTLPNVNHRYGYGENAVNLANFYPIACVYENGWDTSGYHSNGDPFYSDTANYNVSITYPSTYKVAHSGYEVSTQNIDDTKIKTTAKALVVRDFALVLSEKFEVIQDTVNDILVKYFYYDDENAEYSLSTACLALSTFSNMFGNYPYTTFNAVQTNFVHGGMEYPNLIYISDAIDSLENYQNVIIHETAHQW